MLLLVSVALAEDPPAPAPAAPEPVPVPAVPAADPCPYRDLAHATVDSVWMTIDGQTHRLRFEWTEIAANLRLCHRDDAAEILTTWQTQPIRGTGGAYRLQAALAGGG